MLADDRQDMAILVAALRELREAYFVSHSDAIRASMEHVGQRIENVGGDAPTDIVDRSS